MDNLDAIFSPHSLAVIGASNIKGYRLFQGFRGRPPADVETIERSLVSLSNLAVNHPEIIELDINPLLIHDKGQGATAADCRIILNTQPGEAGNED